MTYIDDCNFNIVSSGEKLEVSFVKKCYSKINKYGSNEENYDRGKIY